MPHVAAACRGVSVCVPRTGDEAAARCVPRPGDPATGVAKDSVDDGVVTDAGECSSSAAAADVGVASNCRAPAGSGVVRHRAWSDVGAPAGDAAAAGNVTTTPLGFHLSLLPVEPRVGKMLVMGCVMGCLSPVLTAAAAMSCRPMFTARGGDRADAAAAKRFHRRDELKLCHAV